MKKSFNLKFITIAIAVLGFSVSGMAQVNATATATAEIIDDANSITKTSDLNFGKIIRASSWGSVSVDFNNQATYQTVSAPANAGVTTAYFTVHGTSGSNFYLTVPGSLTLTSAGGNSITVNTISVSVDSVTGVNGTIGEDGTSSVSIGGTLGIPGNQATGVYSNTTDFVVTVNYN